MDEEQSGDTNPNKVRGGHVGYLRQLYDEAESLLQQTLQVSEVAKIRETIDSQFKKYVNAHHYCVEKEHSLALVEKHDQQVEMYQEIRNKLDNYLKEQGATKNVDGFTPKAKSSEISSLKTVSKKEVELKVKYELYKLKLKQLEEYQRIERQQQEIKRQAEMQASQHEIDQAKLESELWEQASSNEGNEDKKSVTSSLKLDLVNKDQVVESTDVKTKVSVSSSMTFTQQVNTNIQSITPEVLPTVSSIVTSSMNPSATTFVPSNSQPQTFSNINPAFTTSTYSAIHPGFSQPYVSYVPPYDTVSQSNMLTKVLLDSHLPKPELMVFNGDARNYQSFITNFETHIGSKVNDPSVKLTYLMQYCTGDVKQLLKNCVLMPPNQGYATAVTLLQEHFGQNHVIARSYIDGLIHGPQVKANDVDGLTKLSRDLLDCQIVLSQLKFTSDMDSSETIWCIAKRLPNHLHAKWVDQAADILQKGRESCYNDICRFIEAKARIGNTVYGRKYAELLKAKFPSNKLHIKQKGAKISTLTTQVNVDQSSESSENPSKLQYNVRSGSSSTQVKESSVSNTSKDKTGCVMCNSLNHEIDKCFRFIKLSLSEKLEIVKSAKLCFRCLKIGHFSKDCKMNCTKCHRRHNVLLHDDKRSDNMKTKDTVDNANLNCEPAPTSQNAVNINTTYTQSKSKVCLGIVPVKIEGNGACVETYALLDSGSNTTLLKRELYDSLDLDGAYKSFTVQTLSGSSSVKQQLQTCLTISSLSDNNSIKVQALTVDRLPVSIDCIATSADINQWDHLKGICLPEIQECQVGLLIGTNSPEMFWSLEERRGNHGEPMARRTLLGWIIIGPISQSSNQGVQQVNLIKVDELQKQLNRQWEVDFQDLSSNTKQEISDMSKDDKAALKIMQDTVEFVNGKYTLSIPWKIDPNTLPNNRKAAETRLKFLKKRFESDEKLQVQYTKTVTTYINDGHACIVNSAEITKETPQWYLPHHPVFKHSNPDKCRVVFDCAARFQGISLNEAIYQGPNLLNNLSGVLIRFRAEKVAIVADIEAMFHQCYVSNKDKNFLRFLWWQNGDTSKPQDVYAMQVHLFGATSSPSVANFCIHKTCEDHGSEYSKEAIQTVQRSFYMDDLLKSVKTIEEAINIVAELKELLGKGGFNLTKWMSSHREVITIIPEKDRAKSLKNLNITEVALPQEPTLGLQWNVEEDSFTYDISIKEKPLTRRGILSMTASLYDPLGFVCPVTLIPKLIQQNLCRNQLEWDDEIPTQEAKEFVRWQQSLSALSSVSIKRCFKSQLHTEPLVGELHIFSDASEFAYDAVAYVKLYNREESTVQLIMAKSRVAPLKAITIPRLELTAATVAAKIYQFLQDELNFDIHQVYFWTDSMIVLKYLQNTSTRFKRFVSNRIQMIQESTHVTDWNYVPSSLNPADLASRGIRSEETAKLNYWFQGPSFLQKNDNYQENFKMKESEAAIDENEIKHAFALEVMTDTESFIQYFSQYEKLLAAVSWLRKFVLFLKIKTTGKDMSTFQKQIRVSDLEEAEKQVIRYIQAREFEQEIKSLQENKPVLKLSVLSSLCPIYESELLRVGGRLQDSSSDVNKHAVILPSNYVTDMIVKHIHEKNGHTGINHCLSVVRRKFFLLKGYKTVKRVIGSCFQCKRSYKKPCEQKMANLPEERTAVGNPPFTVIGIDYFGPMLVKHGRGTAKRYGCLFTCLTTRAVHLEISHSLDSDSFLMAFYRFIARRGKPIKVWSDNGRNFVKAEKELKEVVQELNSKKVTDAMLMEAIEWIFLPPHAPHMGGIWERLVRSVKNVLRLLINQNLVTDEQLVTFMCEVEKIMNDRPLTTVSSDAKDDLPITPNHLLLMKRNDCNPMCYSNYVQRRWKVIHHIANRFYSRFVAEYLPLLQERPKWREVKDDVKVNDMVLVLDENLPRGQWPLGLVKEVKCGRDGLVRSVQVKVGDKIKTRPITKLVLLEHHDE